MNTLGYTLLSVSLISLLSLAAVFALALKEQTMQRLMTALIAFAAGTMLGASFLHLIPEALEGTGDGHAWVLGGIIGFFLIERAIHWHHCNEERCIAPAGYLNLIGDGAHNFTDGVIIAAAFLTNLEVGMIASVAIAMHELPQELGDFAVLVHSGFTPKRAIWLNFLTACTAIVGGLAGYLFLSSLQGLVPYVLGVAAGGLVYVAVADLMPELHKERRALRVVAHTASLFLGLSLIIGFTLVAPHAHVGLGHTEAPAAPHEHSESAPRGQAERLPEGAVKTIQDRGEISGKVPDYRHRHLHSLRDLSGDLPGGIPG